jgi:cell division inhibitor SepF
MFESLSEKLKKMKEERDETADISFKPYEEREVAIDSDYEQVERTTPAPIVANSGDDAGNIELKVVRPSSFDEVGTIADYLLEGCTVVLNLEVLDTASTVRMLDFLNGVTYSTDGDIKNVSKSTYIITPHNVDVSDDK